jgi:hypothetical protein
MMRPFRICVMRDHMSALCSQCTIAFSTLWTARRVVWGEAISIPEQPE